MKPAKIGHRDDQTVSFFIEIKNSAKWGGKIMWQLRIWKDDSSFFYGNNSPDVMGYREPWGKIPETELMTDEDCRKVFMKLFSAKRIKEFE
jgi:hypothetical protein